MSDPFSEYALPIVSVLICNDIVWPYCTGLIDTYSSISKLGLHQTFNLFGYSLIKILFGYKVYHLNIVNHTQISSTRCHEKIDDKCKNHT